MLDFVNKTISKLFGNKSERDLKELTPFVLQVKDAEQNIGSLSHDELRNKTNEFKKKIQDHIRETVEEVNNINNQIEGDPKMDHNEKEDLYRKIDELKKEE